MPRPQSPTLATVGELTTHPIYGNALSEYETPLMKSPPKGVGYKLRFAVSSLDEERYCVARYSALFAAPPGGRLQDR